MKNQIRFASRVGHLSQYFSRHMMRVGFTGLTIAAALTFAACSKSEEPTGAPAENHAANTSTATAPASGETKTTGGSASTMAMLPAGTKADIELNIATKGDELLFDKTELKAKAGQIVKLTFKNTSKSSGMSHNVVVVTAGNETPVATAGMSAGDAAGWLDPSTPGIIAHTKMVKPGEADSIVFKAPAAGNYPYICTFPGHAVVMKGVLKVN